MKHSQDKQLQLTTLLLQQHFKTQRCMETKSTTKKTFYNVHKKWKWKNHSQLTPNLQNNKINICQTKGYISESTELNNKFVQQT